jgi:hypothetical protein
VTAVFEYKRIRLAAESVEFIGDRMSYITLRGRRCDIVLTVLGSSDDKSDGTKDRSHEEPERVFLSTAKVPHKNIIRKLQKKVGKKDI